jgi:hypothetical protein
MNPDKSFFFPNLTLLSRASPSSVTYEEVTPDHLTRLTSTWTSNATSIRPVPLQLSLSKMSHAIQNQGSLIFYHLLFFYN